LDSGLFYNDRIPAQQGKLHNIALKEKHLWNYFLSQDGNNRKPLSGKETNQIVIKYPIVRLIS